MIVSWVLRSKERVCEWTFQAPMFRFSVGQDIDEFFSLVAALHDSCSKIKAMMADGLDPQAAIAEWERMISEKDSPVGLNLTMPTVGCVAALFLEADNPEVWLKVKQAVVDMVQKNTGDRVVDTAINIGMPCGYALILKTLEDILALEQRDVPCPCGDPTHWLIKCKVKA